MREDVHMPKRARRKFTPQQKADAVRLVHQVGNLSQVARDLDLNPNVLRSWRRQAEVDAGKGPGGALTTDERAELTRLRRENRTLEMERDFLKKAAAFFAKDPERSSR
jgi:transposase